MYRIRFHGRGGQGMKTAGRILGNAFFREGFEVQDAPRYGAERRGAPITSYVRAAKMPINERGIIVEPDLVIVADDTLVPVPTAGVMQGVTARTVLLIDSDTPAEEWRKRLNTDCKILILPAPKSEDRAELVYVGTDCAAAAARLTGVISKDTLADAVADELSPFQQSIIDENLERAGAAFDEMAHNAGIVSEGSAVSAATYAAPEWVDIPLDDASLSGPAIHAGATSIEVRTGLWRTMRPVIDYDRCNKCTWVCGSFCPDGAISVGDDGFPVIDLDHCKGCLICVAQCPPHAIRAVPEHQAAAEAQQDERTGDAA